MQEITDNAWKQEQEKNRAEIERNEIAAKERQIEELKNELGKKELELREKKHNLNWHKIFTKFLEDVVDDKVEDNWEFEDIESLKNWFGNLRWENERLLW